MPTLTAAARSVACDAIVGLLDAGDSAGRLIVTTVDGGTGTTLATITLNDPAFGAASSGVATADLTGGLSDTSADATGTAAGFALQSVNSGTPTTVISGDVGTSGTDIIIDNTSITSGQTVNLTALTVTVPAS